MRTSRTPRFRWLAALALTILVAGACSTAETPAADGNSANDSTTNDEPVADEPVADEPVADEPVADEPVVEEPEMVMLSLTPDPVGSTDELETVNPLEQVYVQPVEGGTAILFPIFESGVTVTVDDTMQGVQASCTLWMDPTDSSFKAQCDTYNQSTGEFGGGDPLEILDDPMGYGFVAPLMADQDYVSLTIKGTVYMAQSARFGDEPNFVQIDPNTGNLSQPVTRTVGYATAAEIMAALG